MMMMETQNSGQFTFGPNEPKDYIGPPKEPVSPEYEECLEVGVFAVRTIAAYNL
jgi:hypothetical protein